MSRRAPPAPPAPRREDEERDDNYDDTPLQHQKPFGAGFQRRQKVAFVRAVDPETQAAQAAQAVEHGSSVSDAYLRLVLGGQKTEGEPSTNERGGAATPTAASRSPSSSSALGPVSPATLLEEEEEEEGIAGAELCSVCGLTLDDGNGAPGKHEASIAHQVCLAHSHPPSALDRRRMGFRHLASRGWDADARLGLGAQGAGILNPLQPRQKVDRGGIGLPASVAQAREAAKKQREEKRKKLSVKEMRKLQAEEKKKAAWLHDMFYAKDDVLKHLGRGL